MANIDEAPLVSVIMPLYNSARHVKESIESVQAQTFGSWEICVTDDCSTDDSADIVAEIAEKDPRIKLFKQSTNQGAASARNISLENSKGRYVAFLDADDLWAPEKLERQIMFMEQGGYGFSCASYEVIGEDGKPLGKSVTMPNKLDLDGFLLNNYLQTVGIMADLYRIDKDLLRMPDISREDAGAWIQVLEAGYSCYGLSEILCYYRRTEGSLSSNKFKSAKGAWQLYREVAGLTFLKACCCFARYACLAIWKRSYNTKTSIG